MKKDISAPSEELRKWAKEYEKETEDLNKFTKDEARIFRLGLWSMYYKLNDLKNEQK